jgi:hypothetical protein
LVLNNPEYILVEEIGQIVLAVKTALELPVLNYQYGYLTELNETLIQYSKTPEFAVKKYPLIWLVEPYTIIRRNDGMFGHVDDLRIFIMTGTQKTYKAWQRRDVNFTPVLQPIYRRFMEELTNHSPFIYNGEHRYTERYYWGENQQSQLNDVVDVAEISRLSLMVNNNPNC